MRRYTFPHQIDQITRLVGEHFRSDPRGLSLLPTLVIYSLYECLIEENVRLRGKQLSIGDTISESGYGPIEDAIIIEDSGKLFEVIVVRNQKTITSQVVTNAFHKFWSTQSRQHYFLTTSEPHFRPGEHAKLQDLVHRLETEHNCEIIIDGVLDTLKYYLRVLDDPAHFWQRYLDNQKLVPLSKTDPGKKHLKKWHSLKRMLIVQ